MKFKDLFDLHTTEKKTIFIEEWLADKFFARHFCFGYRDKSKGLISLNRDGEGTITLIDGNQETYVDLNNKEFILCNDMNGAEIKLKFFKGVAHRFKTQSEVDEEKLDKKLAEQMEGGS